MIKFNNQVPSVYPSASRDFQYLSWLIDIVLNSVKHNVDGLYDLPNTKDDPKLTELLAMTLGFRVKRNYDQKQLAALVAVLPKILKYKGTKLALYFAGNALIAASGAVGSFGDQSIFIENGELNITLPKNLIDVSLFTDLLPYILPAGVTCHIIRKNQVTRPVTTDLGFSSTTLAEVIPDISWNEAKNTSVGLATMFDAPTPTISIIDKFVYVNGTKTDYKAETLSDISIVGDYLTINGVKTDYRVGPTFANFTGTATNKILNAGLLDNSIIPTLATVMSDPLDKRSNTDEGVDSINDTTGTRNNS